jgi:hypothetical protein
VAWRRESLYSLIANPIPDFAMFLALTDLLPAEILESGPGGSIDIVVLACETVLARI